MSLLHLDLQPPREARIRGLMVEEIEHDLQDDRLHPSDWLTARGELQWPLVLIEAAREKTDAWLANQLRSRSMLLEREPSGRKVPVNAAETLAEGEFNRFYCRAVCRLAQELGTVVIVYRAKNVEQPRERSELLRGQRLSPDDVLLDLRAAGSKEPLIGVPGGWNSGISLTLPER
ncbi:hypothetical protein ACNOYE_20605 [Nannocystaceae bacterium ST9]